MNDVVQTSTKAWIKDSARRCVAIRRSGLHHEWIKSRRNLGNRERGGGGVGTIMEREGGGVREEKRWK